MELLYFISQCYACMGRPGEAEDRLYNGIPSKY